MLNSVVAAQMGHRFIYRGMDVQTSGNDLAHEILRGGVDKYGTCQPNYHYEDCLRLFELYQKKDLKNHTRRYNPDLKNMIKGVMVESYLEEGRQNIGPDMVYGKSITDPCIGWEDTEHLIYKIAEEC